MQNEKLVQLKKKQQQQQKKKKKKKKKKNLNNTRHNSIGSISKSKATEDKILYDLIKKLKHYKV